MRGTTVPQVLLVQTRRADGWIEVLLPDKPQPTDGWVRAFDVKISRVAYRMVVSLAAHRITVYKDDAVIFRSPIRVESRTGRPHAARRLLPAPDRTGAHDVDDRESIRLPVHRAARDPRAARLAGRDPLTARLSPRTRPSGSA